MSLHYFACRPISHPVPAQSTIFHLHAPPFSLSQLYTPFTTAFVLSVSTCLCTLLPLSLHGPPLLPYTYWMHPHFYTLCPLPKAPSTLTTVSATPRFPNAQTTLTFPILEQIHTSSYKHWIGSTVKLPHIIPSMAHFQLPNCLQEGPLHSIFCLLYEHAEQ